MSHPEFFCSLKCSFYLLCKQECRGRLPSVGVRGVPQYCSIKCKGPLKLADLDRPVKGCQIRLFDSLSNGDSHVSELAFFLIEQYWGVPEKPLFPFFLAPPQAAREGE